MVMGNSSHSSQAPVAPGGIRGAQQALIVVFERDESLSRLLIGQLSAHGYEGRSARTPVEVFDLIARYPIRLVLVDLGQAATSRREFWVALDAQRFGRGVQVITYRYSMPGAEPDISDGGGRPDVEVRGPQGVGVLVEAVRAKLPAPAPQTPDSSFLVGAGQQPRPPTPGQPAPQPQQEAAPVPPFRNSAAYTPRQQAISGVLNLSGGVQPGHMPEFMPVPAPAVPSLGRPVNGGWTPEMQRAPAMSDEPALNGTSEQRAPQWMNGHAESYAPAAPAEPPRWPGAAPKPEAPGNGHMNGLSYHAPMPMGDLAALTDAISALAAAGASGYQQAITTNGTHPANLPGNEASRWERGQSHAVQDMSAVARGNGSVTYPVGAPPGMPEERQPAGSMNGLNHIQQGGQPAARGAAETLYMGQQAFAELGRAQDTRSRALEENQDDYESLRRARVATMQGTGNEPTATPSRRLAEEMAAIVGGPSASQQNQMLAPVVAPGRAERSLSSVLVEGQLVSQQRLEVALGIQRLLRGVDIDYRLGEVLLLFKFLTHDQLLAALLVSRGLVTPAQVAAIGRIKQELRALGIEYDLENLLILFRLLSSEQLREVRADIP